MGGFFNTAKPPNDQPRRQAGLAPGQQIRQHLQKSVVDQLIKLLLMIG